jgi:hypothetical protein
MHGATTIKKRPQILYVTSLPVHYLLVYSEENPPSFKSGLFVVPYNLKYRTV